MKNILAKPRGIQYWMNRFFISRLGGIVVEGKTQSEMFSGMTAPQKIHIVNNFAEEYLFATPEQVAGKFEQNECLRILFLSNMLYGKGYAELLESYLALDEELRDQIVIDFAGKLISENDEKCFLPKLQNTKNVQYHGSVSGLDKRSLYLNAHIFCLPTYYPYEGQPFCILEAYAAGCVVITTDHSGIKDIFTDDINGYKVTKQSVDSLINAIQKALKQKQSLYSIGVNNLSLAREKYSKARYIEMMKLVLKSIVE